MKRRYNFERFYNGQARAEGVAVHADSMRDAITRAHALLEEPSRETLRFTDNRPCASVCGICGSEGKTNG